MKKSLSVLLMIAAMLFAAAVPVYAAEDSGKAAPGADGGYVVYFEDGSYLTVSPARTVENGGDRATTAQITAERAATFTNSDGETEWKYTLSATFTYTYGVSVSCTNASYTQTIYKGNWTFSNGAATASGATARGVGKYEKKFLFITVQTVNVDVSLVCDIYGNVT